MSTSPVLSRRALIKSAALSALAWPLLRPDSRLSAADSAPAPAAPPDRTHGLHLGVASISLKDLTAAGAAGVLHQLEIDRVSIFRTHARFEKGTPDECRAAAEAFRAAHVEPVTTSVVNLVNDQASARLAFDNVRAAGLTMMTCSPAPDSLPLVERLAIEYNIRLAIHNHGPEDKIYPTPYEALRRIEHLDPRIGLCLDVGHTMRAHVDPADAIRHCATRLHEVHLKDSLALPGAGDIPVEVGRGRMDIRGILAALLEIRYRGTVAFEYERLGVNPAIGLAESVGYVRGLLAAM